METHPVPWLALGGCSGKFGPASSFDRGSDSAYQEQAGCESK